MNYTSLWQFLLRIKCALLFTLIFLSVNMQAQKTDDDYATGKPSNQRKEKPKVPFKERLVYGGNLGGYFGNPTFLQINPMVGYKTTNWLVNGVGLNYMYVSSGSYSSNIYGASIWSRAYFLKSLFAQTEFETLSLNVKNSRNQEFHDVVPVWFVGGGFQTTGGGLGLSVMILYDLIQDPNSPYSTPVFRIGGLIGF